MGIGGGNNARVLGCSHLCKFRNCCKRPFLPPWPCDCLLPLIRRPGHGRASDIEPHPSANAAHTPHQSTSPLSQKPCPVPNPPPASTIAFTLVASLLAAEPSQSPAAKETHLLEDRSHRVQFQRPDSACIKRCPPRATGRATTVATLCCRPPVRRRRLAAAAARPAFRDASVSRTGVPSE